MKKLVGVECYYLWHKKEDRIITVSKNNIEKEEDGIITLEKSFIYKRDHSLDKVGEVIDRNHSYYYKYIYDFYDYPKGYVEKADLIPITKEMSKEDKKVTEEINKLIEAEHNPEEKAFIKGLKDKLMAEVNSDYENELTFYMK